MQVGAAPLLDGKAAVADAATAEPAEASGVPTHSAIAPLSWAVFVVCEVAAVAVLCCYGGAMNVSTSYAREDEVQLYKTATLMVIPGLLMELSHALSREQTADLSFPVVIVEVIAKLVVYATCWQGNGFIVHLNQRSAELNPVYTLRWLDWAVAVPALSAVSLSTFATSEVPLGLRRLAPALATCFAFVTTAWVGQITPDPTAGLVLTLMSGTAWMVYNVEQVMIILERSHVTPHFTFRICCMMGKNIVYASYGATLLCDNYGLLSSLQVQTFYTYSDVIFKSMQASLNCMSKNWDSKLERMTLSVKATLAERDISRLIGNASAPMVYISQEGIVLGWNSKMEKLTGISVEGARGKLLTDVTDPVCHHLLKQAWNAACLEDNDSNIVPLVFDNPERPDARGARISMHFVARLGSTYPQAMVGVGQDMTELVNSQEILERRSRSTAIVSHELKSPLHGIMGICKIMADEMMQEGHKRYMSMILGCSERMLDLISNIMNQVSLEHSPTMKALPAKRVPVNLLDIIDEVICMSRAAVDKSGRPLIGPDVQLINDKTMDKLPCVSGDPNKFTQLFYNLITNALKFTRNGHVKVSVVICSGELEVDVSDTGCGIEPELLQHIFEPYTQGTPSAIASFQGIGLGLSVAKGIAESHGGKISVKSQLNIGSTFTVTLPCGDELTTRRWLDGRGVVPCKKADSQASLPHLVEEKPLILCVDDDEVNQHVIENVFSKEYQIEKAMDGYEALEYLKSGKRAPCLVLVDIIMPGLDGWEVIRSIRKDLGLGPSELPVVMLSAGSHCGRTGDRCASSAANGFMQKPFNSKELAEMVRSFSGAQDNVADSKEPIAEETPSPLEVAATNHEVARLEAEVEGARAETKAEAERPRVQLREEAEVEERARRKAEAEAERLRAQLGQEEEELARLRAEVSSLSQARGGAEAELERLRQQLDEEVATRQRREHEASQARHESPQLPELPACSERVPAREATWLRQEIRRAHDDMCAMAKELTAHKTEVELQRRLADSKKDEIDFLKSELDLLRQQAILGLTARARCERHPPVARDS